MKLDCCPFCSEHLKLRLFGNKGDGDFYVQCQTCSSTGPYGEDAEVAVAQWNNDFRSMEKSTFLSREPGA